MYTKTSDVQQNTSLVPMTLNKNLEPIVELFNTYSQNHYHFYYTDYDYPVVNMDVDDKKILICFSGGKDSLATTLYYKERGYNITLFHIKNINATYRDEYKTVKHFADLLELPLIVDEVNLRGKTCWIEHPMKNMIICSLALQHLVANNEPCRIAFGNFSTSELANEPFEICGGDCVEMWDAFNSIAKKVFPSYELLIPLENFYDTIDILLENSDLLQDTQSCIGSYRYREYTRKNNEKKYNIELPEHRCGSCWKCCLEYCIFCDKGIYEYNEEYYKHCLRVLRTAYQVETGERHTRDEVWNHYFYYPRSDSSYKGKCWANKSPSTFRKVKV